MEHHVSMIFIALISYNKLGLVSSVVEAVHLHPPEIDIVRSCTRMDFMSLGGLMVMPESMICTGMIFPVVNGD